MSTSHDTQESDEQHLTQESDEQDYRHGRIRVRLMAIRTDKERTDYVS